MNKTTDEILNLPDEEFLKAYNEMNFSAENESEEINKTDENVNTTVNDNLDENNEEAFNQESDTNKESFDDDNKNNEENLDTENLNENNNNNNSDSELEIIDYEKQYKDIEEKYNKLMQPFKANGRMIELQSPEELISLAQKGADYNKKMEKLKPHRRILKTLEENQLMDENTINTLIDIKNGNLEALTDHIKKLKINPFDDIDLDREINYTPKNHVISDKVFSSQEIIDEIYEDREFGQPLIKDLAENWDEKSQSLLSNDPQSLRHLHDHKKSGLYETISNEVARQKALGNFVNNLDVEAYYLVGKKLETEGKLFNKNSNSFNVNNVQQQKPVVDIKADLSQVKKPLADTNEVNALKSVNKSFNNQSQDGDISFDDLAKLSDAEFIAKCKQLGI